MNISINTDDQKRTQYNVVYWMLIHTPNKSGHLKTAIACLEKVSFDSVKITCFLKTGSFIISTICTPLTIHFFHDFWWFLLDNRMLPSQCAQRWKKLFLVCALRSNDWNILKIWNISDHLQKRLYSICYSRPKLHTQLFLIKIQRVFVTFHQNCSYICVVMTEYFLYIWY